MKTSARFFHIDGIRALAIIGMILTHVLALHLSEPNLNIIWNYLHFVVVGLVFCSAYVFAASRPKDAEIPRRQWAMWFGKRLFRLYFPFAVYLLVHYSLWYVFPTLFWGFGLHKSVSYIVSTVLLTGGVDVGWLTLLFIQLAILSPFLLVLSRRRKTRLLILFGYIVMSVVMSFYRIPMQHSRMIAWLPWSLIAYLGYIYADTEKKGTGLARRYALGAFILGLLILSVLHISLQAFGQSLMFTSHKYPPDLYYFSYGITLTSLMLLMFSSSPVTSSPVTRFVTFLSKRAYAIFFIHIIVLDFVWATMHLVWWKEAIVIGTLSILGAYVWDRLQKKLSSRQTYDPRLGGTD
jgi:peptidoglycan/LPS O-acetylase OafA/YrhL